MGAAELISSIAALRTVDPSPAAELNNALAADIERQLNASDSRTKASTTLPKPDPPKVLLKNKHKKGLDRHIQIISDPSLAAAPKPQPASKGPSQPTMPPKANNNNKNKNNKKNGNSQKRTKKSAKGGDSGKFVPAAFSHNMATNTMARRSSERIRNTELVANIYGNASTSNYTMYSYDLNPGDPTTFPWLSSQAQKWEQYHFNSLRFGYSPRVPITWIGNIIMSPEYDPDDDPPISEQTQSQVYGSRECQVWDSMFIKFDPKSMHGNAQRKFVRQTAQNGSYKNYDVGQLFLGAVEIKDGASTAQPLVCVGKLYVEYDITLYNPQPLRDLLTVAYRDATVLTVPVNTRPYSALIWEQVTLFNPTDAYTNGLGVYTAIVPAVDATLPSVFDFPFSGTYEVEFQLNFKFTSAAACLISNMHAVLLNLSTGSNTQPTNYIRTEDVEITDRKSVV